MTTTVDRGHRASERARAARPAGQFDFDQALAANAAGRREATRAVVLALAIACVSAGVLLAALATGRW